MAKKIAILMAAGLGSRMAPLTQKVPKPLVKAYGRSMIETVINGLENNVEHIYVVVGYLGDQFSFLTKTYPNVTLIENTEYKEKNNISSIYAASDVMKTNDCFICEADLFVSDPSIFSAKLDRSCYYGKMVKGYSDDWINQRLKAIDARKEFTDELKSNGIESSKEFADLTNLLTKTWSGYSVKEYKSYKGLTKESLRDNMTNMELVLNMLAEVSSTEISKSNDEKSKNNAKDSVIEGSTIAKNTREQIEEKAGKKIVTNTNNKNIKQIKD